MRPLAAALFALVVSASTAAAQETLTLDRVHTDSLGPEAVDTFTIDLEADQFVVGEADQQTVDVAITVYGPDDEQLASFDVSARGPEVFQFDTETQGRHRIHVAPFERQTGRYALALRRVEPTATEPAERVDQLMAAYAGDETPGGAVGVVRDGELIFARGYGAADLAWDVPFDVDTKNNIGSTSKQFTAFAIALLADRGELSLDDDIRDYIPELPEFEHTVTLRHLLTHTSGYREFLNTLALAGRRLDEGDYIDRSEILELVQRQPELQNVPGAEFNYNNTGFALLALVVERVTGQPFPGWMQENVFGPLGMESTVIRSRPGQIVEEGSQGYMVGEAGVWREADDLGGSMGAGGIYTTVADLARWMDNFRDPTVGSPEVFRWMTTPNVLIDGDTTDYGLGLFVDEYRGLERVHHGGADVAHRSMLAYFPALDAGVLAESNNATFNAAGMANQVADAFFGEHMEAGEDEGAPADPEAEFDPSSYDPEQFDKLAGRYEPVEMPSFVLSFSRRGDTLITRAPGQPELTLSPTSDSTFDVDGVNASLTFHLDPDGTADSLTLHQNGDHIAHRIEGEAWEPDPEELEVYAGRYFSPELETFYELAVEDGTLRIEHRRFDEPVELTPTERDAFTGTFPVAQAEFIRNDAGEIVALEVSSGRTRGVRFERVELEL
ncbi:MAG: serine hydrolase domain-containing protein [Candidatus Longimicrobiales bacterium M2_2A_002]